jgi:hypothetical protein
LVRQVLRLLFEKLFDGSRGEAFGGGDGHVFHGIEVDIESGSVVAEGLAGDNFAPLFGEVVDGDEIFVCESASCHDQSLLEVRENARGGLMGGLYYSGLCVAKWVVDP